jgi:hypothetical protein
MLVEALNEVIPDGLISEVVSNKAGYNRIEAANVFRNLFG